MSKLMLIDAAHPEETRVAVVTDGQIEDFDFEARDKRQLRGNIYLAKVTRVEPSLQAAFVDYGGNRHGFLAFSEIHPDYYQIPKEDREALLAEAAEDDGDDDDDDDGEEGGQHRHAALFQRRYKIQEVIRRRQVILIQVVKEERGNKGAAVTTYLSLAGRYCVLMPNTARGGGISRKITNAADRKRLKKITAEFEVPRGAGLIVRTAGAKRTKLEVRRDFEYLSKLWQQIVGKTMESHAPCLIHEEGHLVLRAVRDLYDKDVEQIVVEGDEAYSEAKNFVSMLMPSHARKVVQHAHASPLFVATGAEEQLESIFSPVVQLPSGGYIVINQTEALVAIDVNSGKATRERNVESTALKTNLEAASEACRQMRLRDLAGLIVIDFIDMEESKNNRAVEKRMKDSLRIDRARVQTGRISQFGLFEISRQRRRAGVLELSSEICKHCGGTGRVRAIESAALQLMRTIEARANDDRVDTVNVKAPADVALYILNEKRAEIADIETDNHVSVRIEADPTLKAGEFRIEALADDEVIEHKPTKPIDYARLYPLPPPAEGEEEEEVDEEELIEHDHEDETSHDAEDDEDGEDDDEDSEGEDDEPRAREDGDRSRRRNRRGGRRRRGGRGQEGETEVEQPEASEAQPREGGRRERGGRRRRRGGRGNDRPRTPDVATDGGEMLDAIAAAPFLTPIAAEPELPANDDVPAAETPPDYEVAQAEPSPAEQPFDHEIAASAVKVEPEPVSPVEPVRSSPQPAASVAESVEVEPPAPAEPASRHAIHASPEAEPDTAAPRRMGWWNRKAR